MTFCLTRYSSSSPFLLHFHEFLITFGATPIIIIWKSLNQTSCRDTDLRAGGFKSPFLSQMYSLSCENPGREHYFSLVLLFPVESSVNCTVILSASPSTASLDSDLPLQCNMAGSWFLFGMLRTADMLCASLVHRRRQEREGFC